MTMAGLRLAKRMQHIEAFEVMRILARAKAMQAAGRSIIHLEVGEPDFVTADAIIEAGIQSLRNGETHYTPALGLPALRAAIANYYRQHYGVDIGVERIIITPGASGALQLALGVLINPGDQVLMADPGYPCNRHFVHLFGGLPLTIPVTAEQSYQLNAGIIKKHWQAETAAVMLATPANPTGTIIDPAEMKAILAMVDSCGGVTLVDEIYQGLCYSSGAQGDTSPSLQSALALSDKVFVVNSFSKYFGMTGWRLGWLVVPDAYIDAVDRLAQNIFLAPSTLAQHAALAAFNPQTLQELDRRRDAFKDRRDFLLPALRQLGFTLPVTPQGAFYLYADCSRFTDDSDAFVLDILQQTGVALTPGRDFGRYRSQHHLRFAYTASLDKLQQSVERLNQYLRKI